MFIGAVFFRSLWTHVDALPLIIPPLLIASAVNSTALDRDTVGNSDKVPSNDTIVPAVLSAEKVQRRREFVEAMVWVYCVI